MPNHVTNRLIIRGSDQEVLKTMADIMEDEGRETSLFHYLIPCPDDLMIQRVWYGDPDKQKVQEERELANIEKHGYPTWYEFNCSRWGTKWDAYSVGEVTLSDGELILSFDTAWSAPIPIFEKLHEMGFEVEAVWFEEGIQSWGFYDNGECEEGSPDDFDLYDELGPIKFYEGIIPAKIFDAFPYLNEYIQECQADWEDEQHESEQDDDASAPKIH